MNWQVCYPFELSGTSDAPPDGVCGSDDHDAAIHVLPINDTVPHLHHASCPCGPLLDDDVTMYTHHAKDGRL